MQKSSAFHENPFWGFVDAFLSLVLLYLGAVMRNLHWLLYLAWIPGSLAIWIGLRSWQMRKRVIALAVLSIVLGAGLCLMDATLQPRLASGISFQVDTSDDFIISPERSPGYKDWQVWRVRAKLTTKRKLKNACIYVTNLSREGDPNFLRPFVKSRLAWYTASDACTDIDHSEYFVLFVTKDAQGNGLQLFLPKPAPEHLPTQDLPNGRYSITVSLSADQLDETVEKTFMLDWYGNIKSLRIQWST